MAFFSSALRIIDSRRAPSMTRSRAFSKSIRSISLLLRRTATSAASLTRLARSAPDMPGWPGPSCPCRRRAPLLVAAVDLKDRLALAPLGQRDDDLTIETTGAQQRRVEDVGAVGGRQDDDALGRFEAVHLGEHLVERLLTFIVAATHAGATLAADRVDLVDEDDCFAHALGLLEEVTDAAGADTDKHLHEVGAGDAEKADARFAGDGSGEQGLAGAGRTHEEDSLGHARPNLVETLGHRRKSTTSVISCLTPAYPAMSSNVVDGRLESYAFALLLPIDMTPPIWPWARRCIQMRNPMIKKMGNMKPSRFMRKLLLGALYEITTPFSSRNFWSPSNRPASPPPVVLKLSPLVSSPVILPEPLFTSISATLPSLTSAMNSVYDREVPSLLGQKLGISSAPSAMRAMIHQPHLGNPGLGSAASPGPESSCSRLFLEAGRSGFGDRR